MTDREFGLTTVEMITCPRGMPINGKTALGRFDKGHDLYFAATMWTGKRIKLMHSFDEHGPGTAASGGRRTGSVVLVGGFVAVFGLSLFDACRRVEIAHPTAIAFIRKNLK